MTEEEIEQKAEEYANKIDCTNYIERENLFTKDNLIQSYKDGYKQGQEKECFPLKKDGTIEVCEVMKDNTTLRSVKENLEQEAKELKDLLNRSNVRLAEEQIKNEELKNQIEKMKCCGNCEYGKGIMCSHDKRCMGNYENWELVE